MKRVAILIRGDLNDMSTDDSVLNRTIHLLNRSSHSNFDEPIPSREFLKL
jgi:hypothetical protein